MESDTKLLEKKEVNLDDEFEEEIDVAELGDYKLVGDKVTVVLE